MRCLRGTLATRQLDPLIAVLARFYRRAPRVAISPDDLVQGWHRNLFDNRQCPPRSTTRPADRAGLAARPPSEPLPARTIGGTARPRAASAASSTATATFGRNTSGRDRRCASSTAWSSIAGCAASTRWTKLRSSPSNASSSAARLTASTSGAALTNRLPGGFDQRPLHLLSLLSRHIAGSAGDRPSPRAADTDSGEMAAIGARLSRPGGQGGGATVGLTSIKARPAQSRSCSLLDPTGDCDEAPLAHPVRLDGKPRLRRAGRGASRGTARPNTRSATSRMANTRRGHCKACTDTTSSSFIRCTATRSRAPTTSSVACCSSAAPCETRAPIR